jgi:hypothetical protein
MPRWLTYVLVLSCCAAPLTCYAEEDTPPSILSYALRGLGPGLGVGAATGYMLTLDHNWHSEDWRTVGLGAGIGALSGMGVGLILGAIDAGASPGGPGPGYYILQDMSYGVGVGFLAGGIVGALYWIGGGDGSDMLHGFAYGILIGAGSGLVVGIIESALRGRKSASAAGRVAFNLGFTAERGSPPLPYPTISGSF